MSLDSICKIENEGTEIIKNMDENGQQSRDMAKEKIDVKVSEPVAICDQFNTLKHSTVIPYVFTDIFASFPRQVDISSGHPALAVGL